MATVSQRTTATHDSLACSDKDSTALALSLGKGRATLPASDREFGRFVLRSWPESGPAPNRVWCDHDASGKRTEEVDTWTWGCSAVGVALWAR